MNTKNPLLLTFIVASLFSMHALAAGGAGGGGVSAGSASDIQQQDQIRDRIQDPATHTGDEPVQTQDQDRIRLIQTGTTSPPSGQTNQNQQQRAPAGSTTIANQFEKSGKSKCRTRNFGIKSCIPHNVKKSPLREVF